MLVKNDLSQKILIDFHKKKRVSAYVMGIIYSLCIIEIIRTT